MRRSAGIRVGILLGLALAMPASAHAQELVAPFDRSYSLRDVGTPPGVPARLGGLTLKAGTTDRLPIGGQANESGGALYEITKGRVSVRDKVRRKTVTVRAGKQYVARRG